MARRVTRRAGFWTWVRRAAIALVLIGLFLPPLQVLFYRFFPVPVTITIIERALAGESIERRLVGIDDISPNLVRAVIAAEDARFCTHDGFDWEAIQAAVEHNSQGGRRRGGSTISQQTAKNLYLWQGGGFVRKGIEAYYTVLIEATWPKRRIMEAYLNAAEWGDGRFGAEAAAQELFGVSAADLSPLQAARLAAVLPSPNKWSANKPGPYVRRRTGTIMQRARVVANEGLAACVLGEPSPGEKPSRPRREEERPRPERLDPLPAPPEAGPESAPEAEPPLEAAAVEPIAPPVEAQPAPIEEGGGPAPIAAPPEEPVP